MPEFDWNWTSCSGEENENVKSLGERNFIFSFTFFLIKILGRRRCKKKKVASQFVVNFFIQFILFKLIYTLIQVFCFFVSYFEFCVAGCMQSFVIRCAIWAFYCKISEIKRPFFFHFDLLFFYKLEKNRAGGSVN